MIINDSFGRLDRLGSMGMSIGFAGISPVERRKQTDLFGGHITPVIALSGRALGRRIDADGTRERGDTGGDRARRSVHYQRRLGNSRPLVSAPVSICLVDHGYFQRLISLPRC